MKDHGGASCQDGFKSQALFFVRRQAKTQGYWKLSSVRVGVRRYIGALGTFFKRTPLYVCLVARPDTALDGIMGTNDERGSGLLMDAENHDNQHNHGALNGLL